MTFQDIDDLPLVVHIPEENYVVPIGMDRMPGSGSGRSRPIMPGKLASF